MSSNVLVPDASVLLKWVLPSVAEPDVERALQLREAIADESVRAIVPALWFYEVGNTVGRLFPAHADAWLSAMIKFGLEEMSPTTAWTGRTLELVRRHDVSFHDAAYHALALTHDGLFVTADLRYVERAGASGSVIALGDWRP
jgi:predicted nucleic acid-binding protein